MMLVQSGVVVDRESILAEWRTSVAALARDVRQWSEAEGWTVEEELQSITEDELGNYDLPKLTIHAGEERVVLEPVARFVLGAERRVDLYSWPTFERVMLLRHDTAWIVRPELGPTWPLPWGRDTFVDLVKRLPADP